MRGFRLEVYGTGLRVFARRYRTRQGRHRMLKLGIVPHLGRLPLEDPTRDRLAVWRALESLANPLSEPLGLARTGQEPDTRLRALRIALTA